jgi:signal transduction histidine kinase
VDGTAPSIAPLRDDRALGELVASDAAVPSDARVRGVADQFFARPELDAVALLEGARPVGLLTRARLLLKLARGFGQELWARRPVSAIADLRPLVLPASAPLAEALARALDRAAGTVYDEIVVTADRGAYAGLVPVRELVLERSVAHARKTAEHEAAVARAADLERLDRLRAQFLAHATHELRSPVNAIAALAETIRLAAGRGDLAGVIERLDLLLRSAAGLRGTVDNILDLSRLEAGKVEVTRARFALAPLLEELAATARLLARAKPVAVRVDAPRGQTVETDRSKLRQILLNLVSNAAKFTDQGEIVLAAADGADGLRIEVRDTGPGIRAEDLGRLFVPFGQLEDARVKQEGTGLGLVIARSMAQLLGGTIEVRSRRGAGSTFTLSFPSLGARSDAA